MLIRKQNQWMHEQGTYKIPSNLESVIRSYYTSIIANCYTMFNKTWSGPTMSSFLRRTLYICPVPEKRALQEKASALARFLGRSLCSRKTITNNKDGKREEISCVGAFTPFSYSSLKLLLILRSFPFVSQSNNSHIQQWFLGWYFKAIYQKYSQHKLHRPTPESPVLFRTSSHSLFSLPHPNSLPRSRKYRPNRCNWIRFR